MSSPKVIWDTVALLTLFDEANKVGRVDGALKIQKLPFLAELEGQRRNLQIAHFRFIRYHYGPYSALLQRFVEELQGPLLTTSNGTLTSRGRYVLETARACIAQSKQASEAVEVVKTIAGQYGAMSGTALKNAVYRMRVPVRDLGGSVMMVKDIPYCFQIIDPEMEPNLSPIEPFDPETLQDLQAELAMSDSVLDRSRPEYKRTISDALKRAELACS